MTPATPLRVLYLVPDLRIGGAEKHVTLLMPALDRRLFEPSVICIGEEGALFSELEEHDIFALALHRSKRQAVWAVRDLVRELRRLSPHVVVTRGYNAEALGRVAARLSGVPHSVVWVHHYGEIVERSRLRSLTDRALDRVTTAYFGVAEAQVDYMATALGYPRGKIEIIHNGVDAALIDPTDDRSAVRGLGVADDEPVVAMVAAMRPEKDHGTLLRAAALILETVPRARFLLIGDGPARSAVEAEAEALRLGDRVLLTGSRSDVPALLRGVDVAVLSSKTVECLPIALLEAMAAGRPAVCTAVGGIPEMIVDGRTGYLVPPQDPPALAARVRSLLEDPPLARRMGAAARIRLEEEFSLDVSVSRSQEALLRAAGDALPSPGQPLTLSVVLDLASVGGVEMLLLNLFKHFDPAVVRPRLVCLREGGPLASELRDAGFEVEVLDRSGRFDVSTLPRLVASLRRTRTDVVLVNHHHRAALLLGRVAAKLARTPANIVAAHDMGLTSVGGRVLPRWAVASLRLSDALVLLTPGQGEYLHREEGVGAGLATTVREVVIPNGIVLGPAPTAADRSRARSILGLGADDFIVGVVARLRPQKAHEVMFEAMASLLRTHPRARLVVVGDGDREGELKQLAVDLGIDLATDFLGLRRDVAGILPGFDVSCLSSVHEGVPIAVIEAMAAGVPVVATDCGSLRDLVSDDVNGYLVPVGDAERLANRLRLLADDEQLRTRLGRQGRERAEVEFRIEETARKYERLIAELVHRRRRGTK